MRNEVRTLNDEAIILLYFARDEEALVKTEVKYKNYCFKIAYNILLSQEDAEEIVNDTLHHAWDAIPPENPRNLSAYLGTITRNLALKRLESNARHKRRSREQVPLDELDKILPNGDRDIFDSLVLKNALNSFLRIQTPSDRALFIKRYWHMTSIEALSREMHLTKSAVKIKLFRLRKALKAYLIQEGIL